MSGRVTALWCCLLLAPLWALTMFDRGIWTPDEPREADIAWRMSQQPTAIPVLAGAPFLEKPPLAYWVAGVAARGFPDQERALRAPNLLFACIVIAAIVLLAQSMAGAKAAWAAALTVGTFSLSLQVASWLATDAAMLAGVACALLGLLRGIEAPERAKLRWFALMHIGLAWAFLAKGPVAWLVPAAGAVCLIVIEREWRALRSWSFWAASAISVSAIGCWIAAALRAPDGAHHLAVLLWENVAGRAMTLGGGAAAYSQGHRNYPFKYLLEFPAYTAPWTFLVLAAARRAWTRARAADGRRWRFALSLWLIPSVLLSLATTARGIYAAPTLLGVALLIGLWFEERAGSMDRFERAMLIATGAFVALLAAVLVAAATLIAATQHATSSHWWIFIAGAGVAGACLIRAIRASRRNSWTTFLGSTFAVFTVAFMASGVVVFPALDQWQNLASVVRQIDRDAGSRPLALLQPDETLLALIDRVASHHRNRWCAVASARESTTCAAYSEQPAFVLLLPGKGDGDLFRQLRAWGIKVPRVPEPASDAAAAKGFGLEIEHLYELPQGRRYALLKVASTAAAQSHPTAF